MKQNHFPTSLAESVHMLTHWKGNKGNTNTGNRRNDNSDRAPNLGFHQSNGGTSTTFVPGTDGTTTEHITCFNCDDPGHYASVCPKPRVAFQGMQFELCNPCSFNQDVTKNILPQNWVRIDSGSSFNSFNDSTLLSDIKSCDEMRAYSNGGHLDYEKNGTVSFLPEIDAYNNKNSLANILALSSVTKYCRVTMDSAQADCLLVHLAADETLFYEKCGNGLYFLNMDGKVPSNKLNESVSPYSFFHTVASNKEFFSRLEIEGADKARLLQSRLGWPSDQELLEAVRDNLVINTTVTVDDIRRAIAIYGTAVPLIKGKMIRKTHNQPVQVQRVSLPPPLLEHHPTDELDIDFLYVQQAPYLLLKTQKIKFQSVQCFNRISNKKKHKVTYKRGPTDIINGVKTVISVHTNCCFKITCVNGDNKFNKIEGKVGTDVKNCAACQHIKRIECSIRTLKERV